MWIRSTSAYFCSKVLQEFYSLTEKWHSYIRIRPVLTKITLLLMHVEKWDCVLWRRQKENQQIFRFFFLLLLQKTKLFLIPFSVSFWFSPFFSLVLGGSQPAVYPEGFAPARHGEPEDEVLGHVHAGAGRDRRAAAGSRTVAAASRSTGTQDFDLNTADIKLVGES